MANLLPATVLKIFAFQDRHENKDAYDLVFTLLNHEGGPRSAGREAAASSDLAVRGSVDAAAMAEAPLLPLPASLAQSILGSVEIPEFLHGHPPFEELDDEQLAELVRHTHIEYYPAGGQILQQGGAPASFLYVVRTGAVELIDEEQVLDLLTGGEVFGHPSLLSGLSPTFTARAHEDTLCYLIDGETAMAVLRTRPGLVFLSRTLRHRVIRALEGLNPEQVDPWQTPVETLVHRPPVMAPLTFTIRDAAELMTRERVSSLLVERADALGILTDRDLRSRVLALGRSSDICIGEVLSYPVATVDANTMVAQVVALMLERGVHHVPVVDEDAGLIGVVTDTDLMGLEQKTPFALKADIERAGDVNALIEAARRLPETVCSLVEANVDPIDVGHVVAVAIDTMTRRLLELAFRTFGDPPYPWAWLALGSEARQEQALLTDQDNAFVIDTDLPLEESAPYFQRLTSFVNDYLELAGIPKCRSGVIASNGAWRDSAVGWPGRFRRWMHDPSRVGSVFTAIAFDYRLIAGPLDAEPILDDVIRSAPEAPQLIRHLGRSAVNARPPAGFLKEGVARRKGNSVEALDVKHDGIMLVTNIARAYAMMSGLTENRTIRRLNDVAALGRISGETRQELEESFRLLWQVRLEHQTRQVRQHVEPNDSVDPRTLGPLARQGLREAFRMIARAQDELATELGFIR